MAQLRQLCIVCMAWVITTSVPAGPINNFERDIAPLISKRCLECHNARDIKGKVNLTTQAGYAKGTENGRLAIELVSKGEMPPKAKGHSQKLPADEIALLKAWVDSGSAWPNGRVLDLYESTNDVRAGRDWWSLQPVVRPEVPKIAEHPIDAFILARLKREGMEPAPLADKRFLARRAYFALTGLPPTLAQIEQFTGDNSPDAWERLIDRLLASPHYGERWARFWLDLVRFAETNGYERDKLKPNIWRYRDWVINAFNNDMPYTRFVIEQLAGDEIPNRTEQSVIATGMIRAGTWNDEPNDPADYLYTRLEDMVHTTSSAFLGLTVKCARCHDHKFDPILQRDYYRVASFFWAGYIGQANQGGPSAKELGFDVYGWTDKNANPAPIRLLYNGERNKPGPEIAPGFPSCVPDLDNPLAPPPAKSRTTQRRLQFAHWITHPQNPLTARVLVNRVWQHHFGQGITRTPNNFGFKSDPPTHPELLDWLAAEFMEPRTGGGIPWTLKRLHKLIMLSRTYRQQTIHPRESIYSQRDFDNRNWWKFNRRRLDSEALRDAMLAVSGRLNLKMAGPSFYPKMSDEALEGLSRKSGDWGDSSLEEHARRSIYMVTKRSRLLPLMTTFDFTETTSACAQRDVTTVAPQALALLNNHFVHDQSGAMARRLLTASNERAKQIQLAWYLALGREATPFEVNEASNHVELQLKHFKKNLGVSDKKTIQTIEPDALDGLVLWMRADSGVRKNGNGLVSSWTGRASAQFTATQANKEKQPLHVVNAVAGQPALRFNGQGQALEITGQVLKQQQFTIISVANHAATDGLREIFSNWGQGGGAGTSVFLGTKGSSGIRFTDAFASAGTLVQPKKHFGLMAINSGNMASTLQNGRLLAKSGTLPKRKLDAPYTIGTQGTIDGEYWQGDIAELLVYNRALSEDERSEIWNYLARRYQLPIHEKAPPDYNHLALASLCHVLLNSNEFIYVD